MRVMKNPSALSPKTARGTARMSLGLRNCSTARARKVRGSSPASQPKRKEQVSGEGSRHSTKQVAQLIGRGAVGPARIRSVVTHQSQKKPASRREGEDQRCFPEAPVRRGQKLRFLWLGGDHPP